MSSCSLVQGLSAFLHGGIKGKTICFFGDSTISNATTFFSRLAFWSQSGGPLEGATIINYGENGATLDAFLKDQVTHGITATIAANADLYVMGYFGINDVRLAATDQPSLENRMVACIERLRCGPKKAPIIFKSGNTLLTTDPTGSGFVSPLASAQAYSDLMTAAGINMSDRWPDVVYWPNRFTVYGNTCLPVSSMMTDILHPDAAGQTLDADDFVGRFFTGTATPWASGLSGNAKTSAFTNPWTVYPRSLEDPTYYKRIYSGTVSDSGTGFIRLSLPGTSVGYGDIKKGDIIAPVGLAPFQSTQNSSFRQSSGVLQVSMTSPVSLTQNMSICVYRDLWQGDTNIQEYISRMDTMPYRIRCYVSEAGMNYLRITGYDLDGQNQLRLLDVGDTIIIQGVSPIVIATSGGAIIAQLADPSSALGYIQFSNGSVATGDKTALAGKPVYIFGVARRSFQSAIVAPRLRAPGDNWIDTGATTFGDKTRAGTGSTFNDYYRLLSNARILKTGRATLAAGTVTVTEPTATANSKLLAFRASLNSSTAIGDLTAGPAIPAVSFPINALKPDTTLETNDNSVVDWVLIEP